MLEKCSWQTFFFISGGFWAKEQISQLFIPLPGRELLPEPVLLLLPAVLGGPPLEVIELVVLLPQPDSVGSERGLGAPCIFVVFTDLV